MEDRVSMLLGEEVLSEPDGLGSPPLKTGFPCFLGNRYCLNWGCLGSPLWRTGFPCFLGNRYCLKGGGGFRLSTIEDRVSMLLGEEVLSEWEDLGSPL